MSPKLFLTTILLIFSFLAPTTCITIRMLRNNQTNNNQSNWNTNNGNDNCSDPNIYNHNQHCQTNNQTHGNNFQTIRTCSKPANNINVGEVFAVYAQQMMRVFQNINNTLRLVKYEQNQNNNATESRMVYRVRDSQSSQDLYFGVAMVNNSQGMVQITNFVDSFELNQVLGLLGFTDAKLFNYPCGRINQMAVGGFQRFADAVAQCDGGNANHRNNNHHNYNNNNNNGNQDYGSTHNSNSHSVYSRSNNSLSNFGSNSNNFNSSTPTTLDGDGDGGFDSGLFDSNSDSNSDSGNGNNSGRSGIFDGPDSPFTSVNLKIRTTDQHGNQIIVGSKKPQREYFNAFGN